MEWWHVIFLSLVQGLTEFLPISSSGHLALASYFLGIVDDDIVLEVILHAGSLVALFFYFRVLLLSLLCSPFNPTLKSERRLLVFLSVGTIPILAIGYMVKDSLHLLQHTVIVCIAIMVTGISFLLTEYLRRHVSSRKRISITQDPMKLGFLKAFFVGCCQVFGILPGVSRSGVTTIGGMIAGMSRADAAKYSFLLGIPAILAATLVTLVDVFEHGFNSSSSPWLLCLGFFLSMGISFFSISFTLRFFQKRSLAFFGWYLIGLSTLSLLGYFLR